MVVSVYQLYRDSKFGIGRTCMIHDDMEWCPLAEGR